ncbi:hypothetical protein FACS189425_04120 [Clostridia bacterium]|nr:hypothetical protein FACS189425_04120 [Clostridia bacterium]
MQGLILRLSKQGDHNKILTILTPNGLVSAIGFGARRAKSPLMAVAQPFCYADFQLKKSRGDLLAIGSADILETFFDLRLSIEKLALASDLCKLVAKTTMENTDCEDSLKLLLNTLYIIQRKETLPLIQTFFKIRYMSIIGYNPIFAPSLMPRADATIAALAHITECPLSRLYNAKVSPAILAELAQVANQLELEVAS